MFFDEPTSGLDSSSCAQCIALLKQLAREGRTIICTIHQPSARIFEMFDKLYLLTEGKCAYRGAIKDLIPFLKEAADLNCPEYHNPADFVMEILTGDYGEHNDKLLALANSDTWGKGSRESSLGPESASKSNPRLTIEEPLMGGPSVPAEKEFNTFPTSTWTQFKVLFVRTFKSIIRDKTLTNLRLM